MSTSTEHSYVDEIPGLAGAAQLGYHDHIRTQAQMMFNTTRSLKCALLLATSKGEIPEDLRRILEGEFLDMAAMCKEGR